MSTLSRGDEIEADFYRLKSQEWACSVDEAMRRIQAYTADQHVIDYWMKHYIADHCTLCGNHGVIDSRGTRTSAGVHVGRLNYCICPNGQSLRNQNADMEHWLQS